MPLIGIIAKENDSNFIKNSITKSSSNTKFEIININKKNLENIKNITFETIIINENIDEIIKNSYYINNIIKRAKYLILNSDICNNIKFFMDNQINVITYGLNRKATITVSSIKDDNILICFQRNFENVLKEIIEEQEFNIKINKNNIRKTYNTLATCSILSIYGEKNKNI